jgi:hypothetical protein
LFYWCRWPGLVFARLPWRGTGTLKDSTPTAAHPDSTPAAISPMASKPERPPERARSPHAWSPNPTGAIPIVISASPHVIRPRRRRRHLCGRCGRSLRGDHGHARRRFLHDPRRGSWPGCGSRRGGNIGPCNRRWGGIDRLVGHAAACDHSGKGGHRRNMTNLHLHMLYL